MRFEPPDVGDEFRERLQNWGRCYREGRKAGTSNLYPILRQLWLKHGLLEVSGSAPSPSQIADADFIDSFMPRLTYEEQRVLVGVYVQRRDVRILARRSGDFVIVVNRRLKWAEHKIRNLVANAEKND